MRYRSVYEFLFLACVVFTLSFYGFMKFVESLPE